MKTYLNIAWLVGVCLSFLAQAAFAEDDFRFWTSAGRKSEVKLSVVEQDEANVRLRRQDNGKVVELRIDQLNDADRKYLRELAGHRSSVPLKLRTFFSTHCSQCHGEEKQEADFRVDTMLKVSRTPADAEYWRLALDNLNLGQMPPEKARQPTDKERATVTAWIEAELRRARRALSAQADEVTLRRLNRTEYTIEDLFGVRGDFAEGFPADASAKGFDNNGAALMLSSEQITQYMKAADFVLNRAIQTGPRPKIVKSVFTLHDYNREAWKRHREQLERRQRDFAKLTPNEQKRTTEMLANFKKNPNTGFNFPAWENGKLREPTPRDGPRVDA
ncbi:MAG: DUF1587 domain-containing protein, partial [Planctomycetales bacterium]